MSQAELAKAVGISRDAVSRYERGDMVPSVEVAKKMADMFEVTLDFLVIEQAQAPVIDKQTLQRLQDIANLPEADRESLLLTIDNFIKATKLKAIQ